MLEIFRIQIGQILGGRMKWLMAICLALPVLLTFAAVSAGGLNEIRDELEGETLWRALEHGTPPMTARRVIWDDENSRFLGGRLELRRDGLHWRGESLGDDRVLMTRGGYLSIVDGELWIDTTKVPPHANSRPNYSSRRHGDAPEVEMTIHIVTAIYLFLLYPQVICLLLALFYGTSVLGQELEGKTLTYLFTRPLPRWKFVVGKYLGILTAVSLPTSLSLFASWLLLGADGSISLFATLLATTIGALAAYNAIFILFGFLIPRRAMIVSLLYGIIIEIIVSFMPALVNQFTVTYYLRSLVVESLDLEVPAEISRIVGGASIPVALFALAAITVSTLAIASLLAARKEYVVNDQV